MILTKLVDELAQVQVTLADDVRTEVGSQQLLCKGIFLVWGFDVWVMVYEPLIYACKAQCIYIYIYYMYVYARIDENT